jgi:hypothetical protein
MMSYHTIVVDERAAGDVTGLLRKRHYLHGETVAGLFVHRDIYERGWVVSTKASLAVFGAPARTSWIRTRKDARRIARYLLDHMPDEVKRGEWNGRQWIKEQPDDVYIFKDIVKQLSLQEETEQVFNGTLV